MPTSQWLRTNYTRTATRIPVTGIGGRALAGSWFGNAATSYRGTYDCYTPYGGFIMGSVSMPSTSYVAIDPTSAIASYYGSAMAAQVGYKKIIPISLNLRYALASNAAGASASGYWLWYSLSDETQSDTYIYLGASLTSDGHAASEIAAHFWWAGFIVSVPI